MKKCVIAGLAAVLLCGCVRSALPEETSILTQTTVTEHTIVIQPAEKPIEYVKIGKSEYATDLTELNLTSSWGYNNAELQELYKMTELESLKIIYTTGYVEGDVFISEAPDLSVLSGLVNLKNLSVSVSVHYHGNLVDITPLKELINLEYLELNKHEIEDISALSGLTKLRELHLSRNSISDISPLEKLTNLEVLDISFNNISDISVLEHFNSLTKVSLYGNPISDRSVLFGLTNLTNLNSLISFDTEWQNQYAEFLSWNNGISQDNVGWWGIGVMDINHDGIPELYLSGSQYFEIVSFGDGRLQVIGFSLASGGWYHEYGYFKETGQLFHYVSGGHKGVHYFFCDWTDEGYSEREISFYFDGGSHVTTLDEADNFYISGEPVSREEWEKTMEELYIIISNGDDFDFDVQTRWLPGMDEDTAVSAREDLSEYLRQSLFY
ncbi:MAG: leucine-rich repeat domain-containing protein [Oscillospiraceae bacterium]|nr:leucine-rich repeat domain-containing protein [Oscillospiraceae bacterium]